AFFQPFPPLPVACACYLSNLTARRKVKRQKKYAAAKTARGARGPAKKNLRIRAVVDRIVQRDGLAARAGVRRGIARGRQSLTQGLERFRQLAADRFGGAERFAQDFLVVALFHVGENARARRHHRRAFGARAAQVRLDLVDQDAAGDAGGKNEQIGNPIAHGRFPRTRAPPLGALSARRADSERKFFPVRGRGVARDGEAAVGASENRIAHLGGAALTDLGGGDQRGAAGENDVVA